MKKTKQAEIEAEREDLLKNIVDAFDMVPWAECLETQRLNEWLNESITAKAKAMHLEVDEGEKPVSTGDQMLYRGWLQALSSVSNYLERCAKAVQSAHNKALDYERGLSEELGMHYKAPEWGEKWLEEAKSRVDGGESGKVSA